MKYQFSYWRRMLMVVVCVIMTLIPTDSTASKNVPTTVPVGSPTTALNSNDTFNGTLGQPPSVHPQQQQQHQSSQAQQGPPTPQRPPTVQPQQQIQHGGVALPMGDINVMVVTDIHSWVAGHSARQRQYNADYGTVLSFYERLSDYCKQNNRTFFFVMNGDWVDGTGLAMNGDPSYLIPILQKMPWDAINVGNHELYRRELIEYITRPAGFVESWEGRYLSSNVVRSNGLKPLGSHYRVLHGINQNVLTFGFLYDMQDNADIVTVKQVEKVVQEDWFSYALQHEKFDAIMVLAHMGFDDPLVSTILSKIRKELGDDMPVQFITGHTHIRNFTMLDDASSSFEAGRYLDTVGFVSFPSRSTYTSTSASVFSLFQHKYLDANIDTLQKTVGVSSLDTENGQALSQFIAQVRQDLNLDQVVGCVQASFYIDRNLTGNDSLWRLFREQVVPSTFQTAAALFMDKFSWRYDLFEGDVRIDDAIGVSPFNDTLVEWSGIPGSVLMDLNRSINEHPDTNNLVHLPNYILALASPNQTVDDNTTYNLITPSFDAKGMQAKLIVVYPEAADIKPMMLNQTTTSIWLDYFRNHDSCSSSPSHTNKPHTSSNAKGNSTGLGIFGSTNAVTDDTRVVFVIIALATVFLLGSVNIWQRERTYRRTVAARDRLTMDALREYHDEEADFEIEHELI